MDLEKIENFLSFYKIKSNVLYVYVHEVRYKPYRRYIKEINKITIINKLSNMINLDININTLFLFHNYNTVKTRFDVANMSNKDVMDSFELSTECLKRYTGLYLKFASCGYLIDPRVVFDDESYKFLNEELYNDIDCNYNTTFYKDWEDVATKDRFELFVDQMLHYLSTYGTNYEGSVYVPNNCPEEMVIDSSKFKNLKVIKVSSLKSLSDKFLNILNTPIALSKQNLQCMLAAINNQWMFDFNKNRIDNAWIKKAINNIKNKEAKIVLAFIYKCALDEPVDTMRLLWYIITGDSQVIQSNQGLSQFAAGLDNSKMSRLTMSHYLLHLSSEELKTLSSVYYRYKQIFRLIKNRCKYYDINGVSTVINKLSRYAKTYHKPMQIGFWEGLINTGWMGNVIDLFTKMTVDNAKGKFSCLKAIKLYNSAVERLDIINQFKYGDIKEYDDCWSLYYIRNKRIYMKNIKDKYSSIDDNAIKSLNNIKNACLYYIITNIRQYLIDNNIKYLVVPNNINYALPTSEKNFIGSVPMWSEFDMSKSKHNIIGVYWRNEWGTRDFDLSSIGDDGYKIGWNSSFKNSDDEPSVIFSGDMTNADPEAVEALYFRNFDTLQNQIVFNNRFRGIQGSKFRLFFTQSKNDHFGRGYMVNPNDIVFSTDIISEVEQQMLGVINDNKFIFTSINFGNSCVSSSSTTTDMIFNYCEHNIKGKLKLNDIIEYISDIVNIVSIDEFNKIKEQDETITDDNMIDFNFNSLTKDTFINILK